MVVIQPFNHRRIIWKDREDKARRTLALYEELESPANRGEVGGGTSASRLFEGSGETEETIIEDREETER